MHQIFDCSQFSFKGFIIPIPILHLYVVSKSEDILCVFGYSLIKQELVNESDKTSTVFSDKAVSFMLSADGFRKEDLFLAEPDPIVTMARIIDVRTMLSKIRCPKEFVMALKIYDERIVENAGLYILHCGPTGGNITAMKISDLPDNAQADSISFVSLSGFVSFIKMAQIKFKLRQVQHQQVKQTLCICHSQRLFKYHKIILAIVLLLRLQYK